MRLGQLARQLGITQKEIIDFLNQEGIEVASGSNTKIDDITSSKVIEHYAPEPMTGEEKLDEKATIEHRQESQEITESDDSIEQSHSPQNENSDIAQKLELPVKESNDSDEIEVIRVKKIKLEGVKVVGKIDLPELVKNEKSASETEDGQTKNSIPEERRKNKHKRKRRDRKEKQYISYEEQLRREEREHERKKRALAKKRKESKTRYYYDKVQVAAAPKKVRLSTTEEISSTETPSVPDKPRYRNPIRRFWAWLNGEYD